MSSLLQGLTFIRRSDDDEKRVKKQEKKKKRVKKHKKNRRARSSVSDDDEAKKKEKKALRAQGQDDESCRRSPLDSVPSLETWDAVQGVTQSQTSQDEINVGRRDVEGKIYGLYDPKKVDLGSSTIGYEKEGEERRRESERIVIGDRGASWRAKMLKRAGEKARISGVAVEEIVKARFGAIDTLKKRAKGSAEEDAHLKYQRQGKEEERGRKDGTLDSARPTKDATVLGKYPRRIQRSVMDVEKRRHEDEGREEKEVRLMARQKQKEEEDELIDYDKLLDSKDHEAKSSVYIREDRKDKDCTRKRLYHDRSQSRGREGSVDVKRERRCDRRSRSRDRSQVEDRSDWAETVNSLVKRNEISARLARDEAKIAVEKRESAKRNAFLYGHAQSVVAKASTPSKALLSHENELPRAIMASSLPSTTTFFVGANGLKDETNGKAELNKLAAKALRAQMMGKTALFHRYTEQLNELEAKLKREKTAVNAAVSHDNAFPGALPPLEKEDLRYGIRKCKKKRTDVLEGTGSNVETSVKELVREERMASSRPGHGNMDEFYARNIFRLGSRFKGTEAKPLRLSSGFDEEKQVDTHLLQEAGAALTRRVRHQHVMASNATKRRDERTHQCSLCMQSRGFQHHLMLSLGAFTYLALPPYRQFHAGHCVIVPIEHVCSMVQAEEQVRNEMKRFQAALTHMCEQEYGKSLVFLEQTSAPDRQRHTRMECIPVDAAVALEMPLYFKQEIMQSDQEWHTHRVIIDTSKGGIQQHVPPTFPYFHIEWRTREACGGYAHVIEDEQKFPREFGRQVVAGMLDVTLAPYKRRSIPDDKLDVGLFLTKWHLFDWTQALADQDVT